MAPFSFQVGTFWGTVIYLLIGVGFGAALEMSGFTHSPKLAAQFYFKDLTVIKVMFTAIVVAMLLVFGASAIGVLDFELVGVPATYWWPGIVGGLIMGAGFIIGGFCPGTSLVAASTFKIDGMLFVGGVAFGVFVFGESVGSFNEFFESSNAGRLTLPDWLGVPTGVVVVGIVALAVIMFWGGEWLEERFGGRMRADAPRVRYVGAGVLAVVALIVAVIGQPSWEDKWGRIAAEKNVALANRAVQLDQGEVLHLMNDTAVEVIVLDCRSEADFNLFHIRDAARVDCDRPADVAAGLEQANNTVFVAASNDETAATDLWKGLEAEGVVNAYILGGGVNAWLQTFDEDAVPVTGGDDQMRFALPEALGGHWPASAPDPEDYELEYVEKVVLQTTAAPVGGGCG